MDYLVALSFHKFYLTLGIVPPFSLKKISIFISVKIFLTVMGKFVQGQECLIDKKMQSPGFKCVSLEISYWFNFIFLDYDFLLQSLLNLIVIQP